MHRLRQLLGGVKHTAEHIAVRRELSEQQVRIRALDAYVNARSGRDRRNASAAVHPHRRATDG